MGICTVIGLVSKHYPVIMNILKKYGLLRLIYPLHSWDQVAGFSQVELWAIDAKSCFGLLARCSGIAGIYQVRLARECQFRTEEPVLEETADVKQTAGFERAVAF
jgi:hypothetical protein